MTLTERLAGWTLLVLLAAGAALSADDFNIALMEWLREEESSVTLTVCADVDLLSTNVTLIVGEADIGTRDYPATSVEGKCANFTDAASAPPSDEALAYELIVVNSSTGTSLQSAYVVFTYAVEALTVMCGSSEFVRFNTNNGSFVNEICLPGQGLDPYVCYVTAENPRVCVTGLVENSPNFQVCVTQTIVNDTTGFPETWNVSYLNYDDGSVGTDSEEETVPTELIARNLGTGNVSASSCQETCTIYNFESSSETYDLCGVFTDTSGMMTTANATFQDLDLTLETLEKLLNFQVVNKYSKGMYTVYTGGDANTILSDGKSVGLDCTRVPPEGLCYGFVVEDDTNTHLAVAYDDGTNAVISSTSS